MLEILKFIFSEWYIFVGTIILLGVIGEIPVDIISAIKSKDNDSLKEEKEK